MNDLETGMIGFMLFILLFVFFAITALYLFQKEDFDAQIQPDVDRD